MEIVNGRYRVLEKLSQDKYYTQFLARDLEAGNLERVVLVLPHSKIWEEGLFSEVRDNFLYWTTLDQENLTRLYRFDILKNVDNHDIELRRYFYVREYLPHMITLEKLLPSMKREQAWTIFEQICRGVYFLNLRGEKIPYFTLKNIFSVGGTGIKIKLEDLLSLKIKKNFAAQAGIFKEYDNIKALALILLSLLIKQPVSPLNWKDRLEYLEGKGEEEKKLASVIGGMFSGKYPCNYRGILSLIGDLEKITGNKFNIIDPEKLERFNLKLRLIGRKREVEILERYCENVSLKKKLLLVTGEFGVGKSRLLKELAFRLRLTNNRVYHFDADNLGSFSNPWFNLFREALCTKNGRTEKAPGILSDNELQSDFNKIYYQLRELAQNKPFVVLIDKMEKISDDSLQFLDYMLQKGLLFFPVVASLTGRKLSGDSKMKYLERWIDKGFIQILNLNRLDWQDTAGLIKELLSLPVLPRNFARVVLEETGGNPALIREALKSLKAEEQLYVSRDGEWEIVQSDFSKLKFPKNMIEALREQYLSLSNEDRIILQFISIFSKAAPLEIMKKILSGIPLKTRLEALEKKELVIRMIGDEGYSYDFNQQQLKRLVYREMEDDKKKELHTSVLEQLEKQFKTGRYWVVDEMAHHLIFLGKKEGTAVYYSEAARKAAEDKKSNRAVVYYNLALENTENDRLKLQILFQLGEELFQMGNNSRAVDIYNEAILLAEKLEDEKTHSALLNKLSNVYYRINDLDSAKACARKAIKLSRIEWDEHWEARYLELRILYRCRRLDEAEEKIKNLLCCLKHRERPVFQGRVYNLLGLIAKFRSDTERALRYFQISIGLFKMAGEEAELLKPHNNIGVLYSDHLGQPEKAFSYYQKNAEIARKLDLKEELFTAYNNMASISYRPLKALEYLQQAYRIAQQFQNEEMLFICRINLVHNYLEIGEYSRAFELIKMMEEQTRGFIANGFYSALYFARGSFLFYLGDISKAKEYFSRVLKEEGQGIPAELLSSKGFIILCQVKEGDFWPEDEIEEVLNELKKKNFIKEYHELLGLFIEEAIIKEKKEWLEKIALRIEREKARKEPLRNRLVCKLLSAVMEMNQNRIDELEKCTLGLKEEGLKPLVWRSMYIRARFLEKLGRKKEAAYRYLEALDVIGELTLKVPPGFRLKYLNSHQRWKVRESLNHLLGIKEDLSALQVNSFFDYSPYRNYLRENLISTRKGYINLLQELSKSWKKWEEKVLSFGLRLTDSSRGIIFRTNLEGELIYGLSLNEKGQMERIKKFNEPVSKLIQQNIQEFCVQDILRYRLSGKKEMVEELIDCRALALIPVKRGNKLYGYLYFDCNRILHNISEELIEDLKALAGLLTVYYEHSQLEESSSKDKITGVLTRRFLEQTLREALEVSSRNEEPLSLIIFDIDDFKVINDKYGHRKGDRVLGNLARVAERVIREKDFLGRYGGEEFLVIQPQTTKNEAYKIAEKIRKAVTRVEGPAEGIQLTISLGVASFPEDALLMEELIEKADQALYVAKEAGKNRTCTWKEGFASQTQREDKLAGIITGNLVQDQRRGLVIVELLHLLQEKKEREEKIFNFLGRISETVEADQAILYTKSGRVYARERFKNCWVKEIKFDPELIEECKKTGRGKFMLDWELSEHGTGELYSLIITPVLKDGINQGVLLLASRAGRKEFDFKQYNFIQTLSTLLGCILSE